MGCAPSSARTVSLNNAPSTKSEQETEQTAVPAGKVKKENAKEKKKALEIRDLEDTESDYSLIKTDLETITTLMDFLKGLENYATVEVIDDKLRRLSFFYDPIQEEAKSKQLADFLADINYPDLYMKIQRQVHKSYDVFHWKSREDLLGLLAVYSATSVLWNTCDASAKMCKKVGEAGIVKVIIEELEKLRDYAVTPVRDQYRDMYLRSLLATTHNVIRNCHDNRGYFRDAGAVQLLQHYLGMDKILYRSYALLTLSFVVNDDENDKINTGTENVEFFVGMLQSAVESENHRSQKESPFHVTELVAGMTKLAVNDANKVKFVEQGVLPHLVKLLKPDCTIKEQRLAATALWTLAFHDDNKNKIKNEEGCVEALEKLQPSPDSELRKACEGALWEIGDKEEQSFESQTVPGCGHVMISYNWDVQKRIIKLKEKLTAAGYNVWMDIEKMGGSTLEAMAEAVQGADVVLICMSEKYKYSNPCRSEAEYTYKLQKDYIPIRVQPKYTPDGWLGILVGTKLYFDFSTEAGLESTFPNLVRELGDRGRKLRQPESPVLKTKDLVTESSPDSGGLRQPSTKVSVESWDSGDVILWLQQNELGHVTSKFTRYNGSKLLTLKKISARAPEFFYNSLRKDLGFKNMYDIVSFTDALDKLD